MTKFMSTLGITLSKRCGNSSSRRIAFHSNSGVLQRASSSKAGSTCTDNGDIRRQFLAELRKDPTLFGKIWEGAPPEARQDMMKPLIMALSTTVGRKEFDKADKNNDGVLSVGEFEHWLTETLKRSSVGSRAAVNATATDATAGTATTKISREQLRKLAVISAIPFVGFGFLDNAIMICTGSEIEAAFSSVGLSAMAAAALGNTISDVAGIQAGGLIESMASKLGLPDPKLSLEQLKSPVVKRVTLISSAVGITIGCLLGMAPLLFIHEPKHL